MNDELTKYADDIDKRLASLATADPFDEQPDRNSLVIATQVLELISISSRERSTRKLAKATLRVIKERRKAAASQAGAPQEKSEPVGLISPHYGSTAARDLSAVEHAFATLAEAMHLQEPCSCAPAFEHTCEPCRIVDLISSALGDAREFLLPIPGDVL